MGKNISGHKPNTIMADGFSLFCSEETEKLIESTFAIDPADQDHFVFSTLGAIQIHSFKGLPDDKAFLVPRSAFPKFQPLYQDIKVPKFDRGAIDFADFMGIEVPTWTRFLFAEPPPPFSKWRGRWSSIKVFFWFHFKHRYYVWKSLFKKRVRQSRQTIQSLLYRFKRPPSSVDS